MLIGDSSRLRQVLLNILGNAVKFTDSGEVSLEVRPGPDDPGMLLFEVTDTGIGIAPEQQRRIFEAFTQADDSAVRKNSGTGLGLAISSQLLRLMGGEISVDSSPGEGSTFRFHAHFEPAPREHSCPLAGKTVYIASGHEPSRRSLTELARYWGMLPVAADDLYDVAIVDISDPADRRYGTSGKSLALAWSDLANRTPAGFEGTLMKPVGPGELYRFVTGVANCKPSSPPSARSGALRVLVAEDNAVNQKITRAMLEGEGHIVTLAADGRQAIDAVERESFDVVFMDVQMPELDGIEATEILRKRGYTLPILALTACASSDDAEKCIAAGMNGHLAKPVRRAELLHALEVCAQPTTTQEPPPAVTLPA
jgi:CheY-like chemotaxis protein